MINYKCPNCNGPIKINEKKCKKCKVELNWEYDEEKEDTKEITPEEERNNNIIEREKKRDKQEKYNTKIFGGRGNNVFLATFFLTFIVGIITLIKERDLEYRYYEYKIPFRIFLGIIILYGILNNLEETRKKILELKPSKQFEKFKYENDYLYTDQKGTYLSYVFIKTILYLISLIIITIGGYLLINGIGEKIKNMDLKSIVIIGLIIIVGLLININNKVNKR